ncbi:MAG: hybrid sensor histidine kinase/response regulator [Okeania sp. SIO2F4]|uniref:hybrid sensor histidine kinase/response regulator n=1 Tax=Okeania sp. SIO2F4 TaxID=2607790 RepID=UPI0014295482|nr:hybrid sensor histidine kinase/response regulator [Okeania sp. SIO2F4]NES02716.1 hybrid sensor histidine kinase/response regulator [Okeania sp. SIO2F4]
MNNSNHKITGNILIVDDIPENIKLLSQILKNAGHRVRAVTNGKMALKTINFQVPDLILLDINMPEINGYEVCEQLKANQETQNIPVIFVSALDEVFNKVKAFSVGGLDYIIKPFNLEEVLIRIQNQLQINYSRRLIIKQNLMLEEKNKQLLTSETLLSKKSESLEQTLRELKQAQVKIIQSAKMAGLGQLAAGIAHEVNNSINFIDNNLNYANSYFQELLNLVKLYQGEYPSPNQKIQNYVEDIDLDFLSDDLPQLISSMKKGAERIQKIVDSLGNFSRINQAEHKLVDIHQGIESTLALLKSRLEETDNLLPVKIIKEYAEIPQIQCYPNQLNQVFLNLLNNAIDFLEAKRQNKIEQQINSEQQLPKIWIITELATNEKILIKIGDNGVGIDESIIERIFEPFFTTKKIGKGTGLGLSVSYQIIVEQHHGKLTCDSKIDEGSTFMIEIPINFSSK